MKCVYIKAKKMLKKSLKKMLKKFKNDTTEMRVVTNKACIG